MNTYNGKLSKDLPNGVVQIDEKEKEKRYYKYFLEPFHDIPSELKAEIRNSVFEAGEGIEITDRTRLQEEKAYPEKNGYYSLAGGGVVSVANVKTPDMTAESLAWWADWHGLEHLRYAIWDPEDHYSIDVVENRERLLDDSIPVGERVWGTKHQIWESFDQDVPGKVEMKFVSPWECGYDKSLDKTDRLLYMICAEANIGGVPVFATEVLVKGEDGINEMRCRFWIGYMRTPEGDFKCVLPEGVKPPTELIHNLIIHNHREFTRLNEVLPRIYEEEKDNWEV